MLRNRLRARLFGTVPVSIALHLLAIVFLVIIPLVANITAPLPNEMGPSFVRAASLPPPPEVPRPSHAPAPVRSAAAPTMVPERITRERLTADSGVPDVANASNPDTGSIGTSVNAVQLPRPADPPRHAGPVRAAELPVAPVKIADALPVYPDVARAAHVDGTVILECVIDTSGRVTNIRVLTSVPLLDQAAVEAVRRWRYTPSVYNGRPVSVLMTVTVRFVLK